MRRDLPSVRWSYRKNRSQLLSPHKPGWAFLHKRTWAFFGVFGPHSEVGVLSFDAKTLVEGDAETPQHRFFGLAHRDRPVRGNIVAGHIGFPWTAEMISLATKYPNVYIDTSAYKATRYPSEFVEYLRHHGRKKVLFGSNYPWWPPKDCLKDLEALQLDAETQALFLYQNAQRVFALNRG